MLAVHFLLVVAYTAPKERVPPRVRVWAVAWVRPLFHQGWDLFAPDPPACACRLEVRNTAGRWVGLADGHRGWLAQRASRNLAAYLGGGGPLPDTVLVGKQLSMAISAMARDGAGAGPIPQVRAVQACTGAGWRERGITVLLDATPSPWSR